MKTFFIVLPADPAVLATLRPDRFAWREGPDGADASALARALEHPEHGGYVVMECVSFTDGPLDQLDLAEPEPPAVPPPPDELTPDFKRGNVGGNEVPDPILDAKIAALGKDSSPAPVDPAPIEPGPGAG
jgi:hypothetical protein